MSEHMLFVVELLEEDDEVPLGLQGVEARTRRELSSPRCATGDSVKQRARRCEEIPIGQADRAAQGLGRTRFV